MASFWPSPIAASWGRSLTLVPPGNRRFECPFFATSDLSESLQIFRKMGFLDLPKNLDSVQKVCTNARSRGAFGVFSLLGGPIILFEIGVGEGAFSFVYGIRIFRKIQKSHFSKNLEIFWTDRGWRKMGVKIDSFRAGLGLRNAP